MDAVGCTVGRPTDCFALAQLIVLRHCGDCHSGDAAAWSVPLRAPRPVGSANHRERMDPDPAPFDLKFYIERRFTPTKTQIPDVIDDSS